MGRSKWLCMAAVLGVVACGTNPDATLPDNNGLPGDGDGDNPNNPNNPDNPNNPGDGDGDGDGPGDVCENLVVTAQPLAPDMLIVLDRSASMIGISIGGSVGVNRWNPSTTALKEVTRDLESTIRFGLMTFPHKTGGGSFPGCGTGKVDVQVAGGNAAAIASALNANGPDLGFTPTDAAMREALKVLATAPGPDPVVRSKYVLLVTDGEPSCSGGGVDQSMVSATNTAIKALHDAGIKTYVLGYDVTSAAASMNQFAMSGGTGQYIPVSSGNELQEELRRIAGQLAPCEYTLDKEPEGGADYVRVEVDGQLKKPGEDFTLDGLIVRLEGEHCDAIQDGNKHVVEINVQCEPVIIF